MSTALSVVPLASMCSHGSHVERPTAPSGLLGGEPRHWRAQSGASTSVQGNHSVVIAVFERNTPDSTQDQLIKG